LDQVEQPLYFPDPMLDDIAAEARRIGRSLSWIAQQGWRLARERIAAAPDRAALPRPLPSHLHALKRKQTLFLPSEMLAEMNEHATRLDCSLSTIVHAAWAIAGPEIAALPPAGRE
jgi:uncharacterized small protein (TIGR04563 family)